MKILVLNSGSSSQKSCLFELGASLPDSPPAPLWEGKIEWKGDRAVLEVRNSAGINSERRNCRRCARRSHRTVARRTHIRQGARSGRQIRNCGRRSPHRKRRERIYAATDRQCGGQSSNQHDGRFCAAAQSRGAGRNRADRKAIRRGASNRRLRHRLSQRLIAAAAIYPGPYEWVAQGIRRFGFHGINHQYCAGRAAQLLRQKTFRR